MKKMISTHATTNKATMSFIYQSNSPSAAKIELLAKNPSNFNNSLFQYTLAHKKGELKKQKKKNKETHKTGASNGDCFVLHVGDQSDANNKSVKLRN